MSRHRKNEDDENRGGGPHITGLLLWAGSLLAALGTAYATINFDVHHGSADTHADRSTEPAAPAQPGLSRIQIIDPVDHKPYGIYVWHPAVPETKTLPVLYFLHGVPSDPKSIVEHEGLAQQVQDYVSRGGTPFVLAVPDGNGSRHDDTEWANAADGSDQIEDRVIKQVIPAVEGTHRRDAAHRAIAGFSMGGYGSMNLALRHPDLFGAVASISGYFRVDDPAHMFADRPDVIDANRPDEHLAAARHVRIFLAAAESETDPVIKGEPQRFKKLLDEESIPAVLDERPGGHDWDYVRSVLPDVFAFLAKGWNPADD